MDKYIIIESMNIIIVNKNIIFKLVFILELTFFSSFSVGTKAKELPSRFIKIIKQREKEKSKVEKNKCKKFHFYFIPLFLEKKIVFGISYGDK